jgi:CxxC motif-containing protein
MMEKKLICIVCPMGCRLTVTGSIDHLNVDGGVCRKGTEYARDELTHPVRMVCTTVRITGGIHPVIPVKTDKPIPDRYKLDVVKAVNGITLASPVKMGDVVLADLFGTGVNIVAERDM